MLQHFMKILAAALVCLFGPVGPVAADGHFIVLQSTTSTRNSGLLDAILPIFEEKFGIEVRVVAVGTGQAIKNAVRGDGDVLMVHAKASEVDFVAQGWGVERFDLMYNDFVIIGPTTDPAGVSGMDDVVAALLRMAASGAPFVSRGDDSGTHMAELGLWRTAKLDVRAASGRWYRETGAGMGATLNIAIEMGAYVMADRASWISFGRKVDHVTLVQGDGRLFNQYGVILVNPSRHPAVREKSGQLLVDWLVGTEGQAAIADFRVDGQQLFFPNAK
jgi:tungstate transport system substrate-binding protein